jgi:CRISPR-associated protein (TIGR03986 family)
MNVKSTYNFVPAPSSGQTFNAGWSAQTSHDIPFSDGESGEIEIKMKAESPVFIRNGHTREDAEAAKAYLARSLRNEDYRPGVQGQERIDRYLSFSQVDGKFFIPATSVKGMLRSVFEIMTRSALNKSLVNNDRYSFREVNPRSEYMRKLDTANICGGWLYESGNNWHIEKCKYIYRIHHNEIDKALNNQFINHLRNSGKNRTAAYKHLKFKDKLEIGYEVIETDRGIPKARFFQGSNHKGTLVFTGQINNQKVHDFLFSAETANEVIKVPGSLEEDFRFIYGEKEGSNISEDWKYWKNILEKGGKVPVFFNQDGNKLLHFGLAFMYKLPYEKSIHEMLPLSSERPGDFSDLTESVFGSTSLKGRLFVGNAFSENARSSQKVVREILGTPKASYHPFYLVQPDGNLTKYQTYNSPQGTLRGFKRYPVRRQLLARTYGAEQNAEMFSHFIPVEQGAEFYCRIRFHNLRKVEIGALISAITFHGNNDRLFHSIGTGKPLGYGRMKFEIAGMRYLKHGIDEYLCDFERQMGGDEWLKGAQIRELFAMASLCRTESHLAYPSLADKEFVKYKNDGLRLEKYSSINHVAASSVCEKIKNKLYEEAEKERALEIRRARDAEETLAQQLSGSEDITALEQFIAKYPENASIRVFQEKVDRLRRQRKEDEAKKMQAVSLEALPTDRFRDLKDHLNGFSGKNKMFTFTEEHRKSISISLRECFRRDGDAFLKKRKPARLNEFPWTDIVKWLGEDLAKKLYYELVNDSGS